MRAISVSVGPLASAANNNIATSQTLAAAGALNLNGTLASGGVATLDTPRRILIHSTGNDTSLTWTIVGTNWAGNAISETIAGANNGDAAPVLDYLTVTSITGNKAAAANVYVGTTTIAASPWVRFDEWAMPAAGAQFQVTGTANFTFQASNDDPNSLINSVSPYSMVWDSSISPAVGVTANMTITMPSAPLWGRVLLNSGTGSVKGVFTQYYQTAV